MESFTRGFSEEVAERKIRINCVAPGAVNTPMLWNNPNVTTDRIVGYTLPFLFERSVGGALMGIGHVTFAVLLTINLAGRGRQRVGGPRFFVERESAGEAATVS